MKNSEISSRLASLSDGAIDIWRVGGAPDISVLSEVERARAKEIGSEETRRAYVVARAGVRYIASQYMQKNPVDFDIQISSAGKPFFSNAEALHFSLSHCVGYVAIAFCSEPVGFDMEKRGRSVNFITLARRFFAVEEALAVENAGGDGLAVFLELWTAKEAILKLSGTGLSGGLERALVPTPSVGLLDGRHIFLHRLAWPDSHATVASFHRPPHVRERELVF